MSAHNYVHGVEVQLPLKESHPDQYLAEAYRMFINHMLTKSPQQVARILASNEVDIMKAVETVGLFFAKWGYLAMQLSRQFASACVRATNFIPTFFVRARKLVVISAEIPSNCLTSYEQKCSTRLSRSRWVSVSQATSRKKSDTLAEGEVDKVPSSGHIWPDYRVFRDSRSNQTNQKARGSSRKNTTIYGW